MSQRGDKLSESFPKELIHRARNGDCEALDAILVPVLSRLEPHIRRHHGAILRSQESASDILQSVCGDFLADVWTLDLNSPADLLALLKRRATNKIQDRARWYSAGKRDVGRTQSHDDPAGTRDPSPSQSAIKNEIAASVEVAMQKLTIEDRALIRMIRIEGRPHADVAARLRISGNTLKVRLFRALERLAFYLPAGSRGNRSANHAD